MSEEKCDNCSVLAAEVSLEKAKRQKAEALHVALQNGPLCEYIEKATSAKAQLATKDAEIERLKEFCEDLLDLLEKMGLEAEIGDGVQVKTIRQTYEQALSAKSTDKH